VNARRVLAVLAASQLAAMAPWFSASAVTPALSKVWRLDTAGAAWLTISVQLGFVAGAVVSALLTLSDRWSARRLVAACACLAGLATIGVAFAPNPEVGIALRMLTGAALAGVYPPGMKIVAGWYREGRGLAIGVLVGALTLGSALPHLVRWAVPVASWRPVLFIAAARRWLERFWSCSCLTTARSRHRRPRSAGGRRHASSPTAPSRSRISAIWATCGSCTPCGRGWPRSSRRANRPAPMAIRRERRDCARHVRGGRQRCFGVLARWKYADRWGRTLIAIIAMTLSGACALAVGLVFGRPSRH